MGCCTIFFLQRSKMKNRIVGGHVPSAKIVGERRYSIISDDLGTPVEAYDERVSASESVNWISWACAHRARRSGAGPLPVPSAVPRCGDGARLQSLPLLLARDRSLHQSRPHSSRGGAIKPVCIRPRCKCLGRSLGGKRCSIRIKATNTH